MENYRTNTFSESDKENLIDKFYKDLSKIKSEKYQESKDKIKELITHRINNQILDYKNNNKSKEPIFLSYQEIGSLEFKVAKNYIESLGFKASIHRGNYIFQRIYDKVYVYKNLTDMDPVNVISLFFVGAVSIILLIGFSNYNMSLFQYISFIFNKIINDDVIIKSFFVGFYVVPTSILLIQGLFFFLWKIYCFISYFSFKSGVIKVNW